LRVLRSSYKLLDLTSGASNVEVKKAYRKKALQYHPDVNSSSEAQLKFVQIKEAYQEIINLKVIQRKYVSTSEMVKNFEAEEKLRKREAQKEWLRNKRKQQEEVFEKTWLFKTAVFLKQMITYATVLAGIAIIATPAISLYTESGDISKDEYRPLYFVLIMILGGVFFGVGIYAIKNKID
jgi:hypothetical protein